MRARRGVVVAAGLAALVAAGLAAWRWQRAADTPPPAPAVDDPRLTFPTPYRNVRPGVRPVGDAACAGCHPRIAATYAKHPMGRSVETADRLAAADRYDPGAHNPFERSGATFRVGVRDGRVVHTETRGGVVLEEEVAFAIGSGTRGRSYVVDRGGVLVQSPVSWFAREGQWDASPGMTADHHFNRPIAPECLSCHADGAEPVPGTAGRYRTPVRVRPVGCERCHGPGELHVARQQSGAGAGPDDTIVNPARLDPDLRESVCRQCHLDGEVRVARRGLRVADFRPGLPLHRFVAVFERLPGLSANKAVGQVEQMAASRCYRGSRGKLGCVSCHDPHEPPPAAAKAGFYRGRCLNCHNDVSCKLSPPVRRGANGDDCAACHMPRSGSTDIAHTAVTDHQVRARPDAGRPAVPSPRLDPGEVPLVPFFRDGVLPDDPESDRDLGVALAALLKKHGPAASPLAPTALRLLDGAVRRDPRDLLASVARGHVLARSGRPAEAMGAMEATLALDPGQEDTLALAADLSAAMGRWPESTAYWRRAVAASPAQADYRRGLAAALAGSSDWDASAAEARESLRRDPFSVAGRKLLIRALLRSGHAAEAAAEWDVLLSIKPDDPEALRLWYAEQAR